VDVAAGGAGMSGYLRVFGGCHGREMGIQRLLQFPRVMCGGLLLGEVTKEWWIIKILYLIHGRRNLRIGET
jgi:hypothetical protein